MSIRLRTVDGVRVALCAAETDPLRGDLYLDDGDHYALAAKFAQDWYGQPNNVTYPVQWAAMATQKLRDAQEELQKWFAAGCPEMVERWCPACGKRYIISVDELRGASCIICLAPLKTQKWFALGGRYLMVFYYRRFRRGLTDK